MIWMTAIIIYYENNGRKGNVLAECLNEKQVDSYCILLTISFLVGLELGVMVGRDPQSSGRSLKSVIFAHTFASLQQSFIGPSILPSLPSAKHAWTSLQDEETSPTIPPSYAMS